VDRRLFADYCGEHIRILNFIQYAFGLTQGGISGAAPSWFYDDYWASDYGGNHVSCQGNQQLCPYGLSDFFNFSDPPRSFVYIAPQTYQPSSFVNLQGFGGVSATEPPDEETP